MKIEHRLEILTQLPLPCLVINATGVVLLSNKIAEQYFKYQVDDSIDKLLIDFLQDPSTDLLNQQLVYNNQNLHFLWRKTPLNNQFTILTAKDITSEIKLSNKIQYLKNIIKKVPGYIFWKDKNCVLQGCNENFAKQVGLASCEAIEGKNDFDLPWSAEQTQKFHDDDQRVMATGKSYLNFEEIQQQTDGSDAYLLTSKVPLFDENHKISGVLGIYLDITAKKQAEQAIIKAKEAAEASNQSKTEFLSNMSHDVKTSLVGIVSTADLIAYDSAARKQDRQHAEIIAASGKQLAAFFTSCIELSQLEMQHWATKYCTFSIKQLLIDIHALFAPQAQAKHIALQIEYDKHSVPSFIKQHRDGLYRILLNLVGNAIKFTQQGHVILRALPHDNKNKFLIFQVEDTGIGIAKDQQDIIFEKLKRLTPAFETQTEGGGMGLYIASQFANHMEADIQVTSTEGNGSTFSVKLPYTKVSATEQAHLEQNKQAKQSLPTTLQTIEHNWQNKQKLSQQITELKQESNKRQSTSTPTSIANPAIARVLLVEDTPMIQLVTKSLLNAVGFDVDVAMNCKTAIELFKQYDYDLIYMDIGLPDHDGYYTAQTLRNIAKQYDKNTDTIIIALTGHGAIDIQTACHQAGMQGIISKPLSRKQAERIWQRFGQGDPVVIPDFIELGNKLNLINLASTAQRVGSTAVAKKMIIEFVEQLKAEFLPQLQQHIEQNNHKDLRFLLHQQLGLLAYIQAPDFKAALVKLQKLVQQGIELSKELYETIAHQVTDLAKYQQQELTNTTTKKKKNKKKKSKQNTMSIN